MKKILIALSTVAVTSFGATAMAEEANGPVLMTDLQLDAMVAGNTKHIDIDKAGIDSQRNTGQSVELNKVPVNRTTPPGGVCVSIGGNSTC